MLWVLIRSASLRCFYEYPQCVFVKKQEKYLPDTHSYLDLWLPTWRNLGSLVIQSAQQSLLRLYSGREVKEEYVVIILG